MSQNIVQSCLTVLLCHLQCMLQLPQSDYVNWLAYTQEVFCTYSKLYKSMVSEILRNQEMFIELIEHCYFCLCNSKIGLSICNISLPNNTVHILPWSQSYTSLCKCSAFWLPHEIQKDCGCQADCHVEMCEMLSETYLNIWTNIYVKYFHCEETMMDAILMDHWLLCVQEAWGVQ